MTGTEFISLLRPRIGDVEKVTYEDTELLGYLNDAIDQLSLERITAKDPTMIVEVSVTPGTSVIPTGFMSFAGQYPLYFSGKTINSLDSSITTMTARYYAVKARLTALTDTIPFNDESIPSLINYAVTAASARVGASVEIESALAQRANGAIQAAGGSMPRIASPNTGDGNNA